MGLPILKRVLTHALCGILGLLSVAHAAELQVAVLDQKGIAVVDAVILASAVDAKNMSRPASSVDIVDQIDKQFVPEVRVIYVGSKVRFPNKDKIQHQVYSFSPAKKFELPLYAGSEAAPVAFDKPGVVILGCNIHDWMVGYIYVADTPFFAQTGPSGTVSLVDLPAGDYRVRVWHPNMQSSEEATVQRATVVDGTPTRLQWRLPVKPALKIPRATGDSRSGYP
jgi:plastocyanin